MAFQFLCPRGHLLQADESHVGRQMQCPYCAAVFLVPPPIPAASQDPSTAAPPGPPEAGWHAPPEQQPATEPPAFQPPDWEAPTSAPPDAGPPSFQPPVLETPPEEVAADFPGIRTEPPVGRGHVGAGLASGPKPPSAAQLPVVHVICPKGHSLETPREMLGQEALCPFCSVQFRLRLEDSVEYREEKAKERRQREIRAGQLWLRWAIAAAVVVVLGLVILMLL